VFISQKQTTAIACLLVCLSLRPFVSVLLLQPDMNYGTNFIIYDGILTYGTLESVAANIGWATSIYATYLAADVCGKCNCLSAVCKNVILRPIIRLTSCMTLLYSDISLGLFLIYVKLHLRLYRMFSLVYIKDIKRLNLQVCIAGKTDKSKVLQYGISKQ